jgi:hypothetical protein
VTFVLLRSLPLLSLSLPLALCPPETVSLSFPFISLFRLIHYADRNYTSSPLSSSSSALVSIGGIATEDHADPELIVSFGVCRWRMTDDGTVGIGISDPIGWVDN